MIYTFVEDRLKEETGGFVVFFVFVSRDFNLCCVKNDAFSLATSHFSLISNFWRLIESIPIESVIHQNIGNFIVLGSILYLSCGRCRSC